MRLNIYSQELTHEAVIVSKVAETGITYHGVRMMLASPDILHFTPEDDDRSAITFWIPNATSFSKADLASLFRAMGDLVDECPDPIPSDEALNQRWRGSGMDAQALRDNGIIG